MKRFFVSVLLMTPLSASENWFVPYSRDESTVLLLHFDDPAELQRPAASGPVTLRWRKGGDWGDGVFGRAAVFDGQGATLVTDGHGDLFRIGNDQPFTFECWVRPDGDRSMGLFSMGTRYYFHLSPRDGAASFGCRAASFPIRFYPLPGVRLPVGRWSHVAFVRDETRHLRAYLNGRLAVEVEHIDEGDYEKVGGAAIGSHDGWTKYFRGAIDELRVSSVARSYEPLFTHRHVLDGEPVKLNIDAARLPAGLARVQVELVAHNRKQRRTLTLPRDRLLEPLLDGKEVPPSGCDVRLTFLAADGKSLGGVTAQLDNASHALADARRRLQAIAPLAGGEFAENRLVTLYRDDIEHRLQARDLESARPRLTAAESLAASIRQGAAAYRDAMRRRVRQGEPRNDVRITMSWSGAKSEAAKALPWARRLGANELVSSIARADPDGIRVWKEAGYRTVCLGGWPIHDREYAEKNTDAVQVGWWVSLPSEARAGRAVVKLQSPTWGGESVCYRLPTEDWVVWDASAGNAVEAGNWKLDRQGQTVTVQPAVDGHDYQVYFRIETSSICDPLRDPFATHAVRHLDEVLRPFAGALDVYWFDDLGFAYPGPVAQGAWDWESYALAAHPDNVERFEAETGVKFDPRWLVMPPRTIERPPDRRYLRWQSWVQEQMKSWMHRATSVVHKLGMRTWLYWGDCHVGIEPYLGSLEAGGVDEIDKPSSDPVTARALVDCPGQQTRRLRTDWLFARTAANPAGADRVRSHWRAARRGWLMRPGRGIYWMPFPNVVAVPDEPVRENMATAIAQVNDEFRLLAEELAGATAWRAPIDVVILNAWGRQYSWRPWGAPLLVHLTDMPVRVRFVSLVDVEKRGVPEETDVLFCYGPPGSSWSGGHFWESAALVDAVRRFVQSGGGLVAVQAPAWVDEPFPRCALGNVLGVRFEGEPGFTPATLDASLAADVGDEAAEKSDQGAELTRLAESDPWLRAHLPEAVPGLREAATVSPARGAKIVYAWRTSDGKLKPGVVTNDFGRGRTVHLAGWSSDAAFTRLLQTMVFWAAGREELRDQLLVASPDDVFCYAYPERRRLAIISNAKDTVTARLRIGPQPLGKADEDPVRLHDTVTGEVVVSGIVSRLVRGFELSLPAGCARLLAVE